jgi:hypothetical protein
MPTPQQARVQSRNDSAAAWAAANPVLLAGEVALENDTGIVRVGNGTSAFLSLPPIIPNAAPSARTISAGTGLTGGGDLSANRTLALTGQALALHNLASAGLVTRRADGSIAARSLAGTASQVSIDNGGGDAGNPTVSLVIATTGQAEVGTNNISVMTALRTKQAIDAQVLNVIPIKTSFTSAELTVNAADNGIVAHGLGVRPVQVQGWLVCKTSEWGYVAGEWYGPVAAETFADGSNKGVGIAVGATNIKYVVGSNGILILDSPTGLRRAITPANWRLVLRAFA